MLTSLFSQILLILGAHLRLNLTKTRTSRPQTPNTESQYQPLRANKTSQGAAYLQASCSTPATTARAHLYAWTNYCWDEFNSGMHTCLPSRSNRILLRRTLQIHSSTVHPLYSNPDCFWQVHFRYPLRTRIDICAWVQSPQSVSTPSRNGME